MRQGDEIAAAHATAIAVNMAAISETVPYTNINMAWSSIGVPAQIIKALAEKQFNFPTEIQAQTLPAAIFGCKNILAAAETGSGKTLAFGIPIIKGILDLKKNEKNNIKPLYALVLTPTRELAVQIKNHLTQAAKYTDIKVRLIVFKFRIIHIFFK